MKLTNLGLIALTGAFALAGCKVDDGSAGGADSGVGGGEAGGAPGTGGEAAGGNGGAIITGGSGGAPVGGALPGGNGGEPVGGGGGAVAGGSGGEPVGGAIGGSGGEPVGGGGGAGGAEPGPCAFVECAEGTVCDPETGACVGNELPGCLEACTYLLTDCGQGEPGQLPDCVAACEADLVLERRACVLASACDPNEIDACFALEANLCQDVVCGEAEVCDSANGECVAVDVPECATLCQNLVDCGLGAPDGLADCVVGCQSSATPEMLQCALAAGCDVDALDVCLSAPDLCVDVICADGEACNPGTGACEAVEVCVDDDLEDNDTMDGAVPVMPGAAFEGLQLCVPDEDWYVLQMDAGCIASVHLDFVHADGDVDLAIMDATQMLIDVSDGVTDTEDVTLTAAENGPFYINVFGYDGGANSYGMQVNVACP